MRKHEKAKYSSKFKSGGGRGEGGQSIHIQVTTRRIYIYNSKISGWGVGGCRGQSMYMYMFLMRDEKEGRKKQARV